VLVRVVDAFVWTNLPVGNHEHIAMILAYHIHPGVGFIATLALAGAIYRRGRT